MGAPSINDLRKYLGVILGSAQWNYNLSQIVSFLTTNYDLTGNNITATQFFGDISNCTGFPNLTSDIVAGEAIVAGNAIRIQSGAAFLCDLSSAGITNFIGIATNNASVGQTVTVSRYSYSAYTSLVTDDTYYIDADGEITNTKPATYAKPIGFAISDTEFIITNNSEPDITFPAINTTGDVSVGGNFSVNVDKMTVDNTTGDISTDGDISATGSIDCASITAGGAVSPFVASPFKFAKLALPALNISGMAGGTATTIDVSAITTNGTNVISYSIKLVSDDGAVTVDPLTSMSNSINSGIGDFIYPFFSATKITTGKLYLTSNRLEGGVYESYSSVFSANPTNWDGTSVSRGYITFIYI